MVEIAILVVAARRTLSYSYPIRYFLKGQNKQKFLDFYLENLEKYLEQLSKQSESAWLDYIEFDYKGEPILGEKFGKFKMEVTNLRAALENNFDKTMKSIQNGLSECADEGDVQLGDYTFENKGEWFCLLCRRVNTKESSQCSQCFSSRSSEDGENAKTIKLHSGG